MTKKSFRIIQIMAYEMLNAVGRLYEPFSILLRIDMSCIFLKIFFIFVFQNEPLLTWYKSEWLFVECYLYRLIYGAFHQQKHLSKYDYFGEQKRDSFKEHLRHIEESAKFTLEASTSNDGIHDVVEALVKSSLWGNQSDLSVSGGDASTVKHSLLEAARARDSYILQNDVEKTIREIILPLKERPTSHHRIDIILDNAGVELSMDLFLADFLVHAGLANNVILHGKKFPWFVSDVTSVDFEWTLQQMENDEGDLKKFHERFQEKLKSGKIAYTSHDFWTYPHAFCDMKEAAPDLYEELAKSNLLIFKGDLNYRKLVGDRYWPWDYSFEKSLCGFLPTSLLTLRTLKAETVSGLSAEAVERMKREFGEDTKWLTSGDFAVAQLVKV
ncbi:hypothetical protein WR25_00820 isoform A [Diploscapter pachys]|uniref:Sugar phosphate phosphatase n=1 Tax=Diploscapter pachys TaxID=2018661 RepID=A0A2A2JV35_9BILA|nr:hypothetical protein WR25_00820 isoform A [Diploscapter pachys]